MITEEDSEQRFSILAGDAEDRLKDIKAGTIDCIFTSPDPIKDTTKLVKYARILGEKCKRVLKPTGSMWVHMEDYFDEKGSLMQFPSRFEIRMHDTYGWIVRGRIIWHMPVSPLNQVSSQSQMMVDRHARPTDNNRIVLDHACLYHFTQGRYGYFFDTEGLPGIPCSVFTEEYQEPAEDDFISTGFSETMLADYLIISCPPGGTVLDPFCGTGTTGLTALKLGYRFIGIEKDESKVPKIEERLRRKHW